MYEIINKIKEFICNNISLVIIVVFTLLCCGRGILFNNGAGVINIRKEFNNIKKEQGKINSTIKQVDRTREDIKTTITEIRGTVNETNGTIEQCEYIIKTVRARGKVKK